MKKNLIVIGLCMWVPIWLFSYTSLAKTMLNGPQNIVAGVTACSVMLIGITLMLIGIFRRRE